MVQQCAAGEAEGSMNLGLSAHTTHNSFWPREDTVEIVRVPVRPLDAMIEPGRPVDVVKIDVEGAELQVWRGMQRILAENAGMAVVLEFGPEHVLRAGGTVSTWFAELTAAGRVAWEIDEESASVRPLRSAGLEDVFSLNLLLLRDHPGQLGLRVT